MILSDKTLKSLIETGDLVVSPLGPHAIQPASIDCRLGDHYLVIDEEKNAGLIHFDQEVFYKEVVDEKLIVPPHGFVLATTMEYIKLPNGITAFVEGRSSVGRMGLFIQNAGWVDSGFEGRITLELYNANSIPIQLQSGRRLCQLVFCKMDQKSETPYKGKYQGQLQSVGSRINQDFL